MVKRYEWNDDTICIMNPELHSYSTENKYNLQKYFSMFSIGLIIVLTVVLSVIFIMNQRSGLIKNSTLSAETFAYQFNHRIHEVLIVPSLLEKKHLFLEKGSVRHRRLDSISADYIADYSDIVKIKVYDMKGRIIYSTDPADIGTVSTSYLLNEALKGFTASGLTEKRTPFRVDESERGRTYETDMLQVYVPLYKNIDDSSEDSIIGAFEVYKDVTPLFNLITNEIIKVPIMLAGAMGILYMSLVIFIKNADIIISSQNSEITNYNTELEEAQKTIKTSINDVIEHGSFKVQYERANHKLLKCWMVRNCNELNCPSYESDDLRCWQTAGTFCGGIVQGQFAKKFGDCRLCKVFRYATGDQIGMISESFNNMMKLLDCKHRELQKANEKLNTLVDIDPLTQVGNRRSFQKRIESIHLLSLRYDHPYSIIICDFDNFKHYNDTYGHQEGDSALISVTSAMKESIRETDEIFRWGGEEFIVILPKQNHTDAFKVAENLRVSAFNLGIKHEKSDVNAITISAGVATFYPRNEIDATWENVVKQADDALYKAKTGNKNCVYSAGSNITSSL